MAIDISNHYLLHTNAATFCEVYVVENYLKLYIKKSHSCRPWLSGSWLKRTEAIANAIAVYVNGI